MRKKQYDRVYRETPTGEIVFECIIEEGQDLVPTNTKKELTPKQKRLLEDKSELTKYSERLGGYVHMFYVKNELLFDKLNLDRANIARLIYLSTYIDYNDRQENLLIKYDQHKQINPMTRADIKKVLGLGDTAFKSFMADMRKNELIYEAEKKFYINQDYFSKGKIQYEGKDYTRIYISPTRFLYEKSKPKQHKQLSYIFQLIPYMNFETNILCSNPSESDFYKLEKLNLKQICEILEVSTKTKQSMSKFKNEILKFTVNINGNEYAFLTHAKIQNAYGIKDYFVINPQITWQGNNVDLVKDTIQICFFN